MELDAVIEVPTGSRNKYEMDHESGRIRLDRTLFTATAYPADYGFLPDTLALDGDPLDVLVLVAQATFPGCQITVRPVALFSMDDEHGPDAKILCVPARDPRQDDIQDLGDVGKHLLSEISHFFDVYKMLEPGKSSQVGGWQDRATAQEVIAAAHERFHARSAAAHGVS
ncbi:MAG: inorganic diphosphatase [Sciscionella sp.]